MAGRGSITRRVGPTGNVSWRWRLLDKRGEWVTGTGHTLGEAKKALAVAVTCDEDGGRLEPTKMTFGEWAMAWMERREVENLAPNTTHSYAKALRLHVLPEIGSIPLTKLTTIDVDKMIIRLTRHGHKKTGGPLAHGSVKQISILVCQILKAALKQRYVNVNVAEHAVRPGMPDQPDAGPKAWTAGQAMTFLEWVANRPPEVGRPPSVPQNIRARIFRLRAEGLTIYEIARRLDAEGIPTAQYGRQWGGATVDKVLKDGEHWEPSKIELAAPPVSEHALFRLAFVTGMRLGEICGLRWSDVNLAAGSLEVCQQATTVGGKTIIRNQPKTRSSRRVIGFDLVTRDALAAHRAAQVELSTLASKWTDNDLVFPGRYGEPRHTNSVSRRFLDLQERAGLPRLTFHGIRHTAATVMLTEGDNVKTVAARLGHQDANVTLSVYAHSLPGDEDRLAAKVGARFDRVSDDDMEFARITSDTTP